MKREITIDATNKHLGRVAAQAAAHLIGKDSRDFAKNVIPDVSVHIVNASKLSVPQRKLTTTTYVRYSLYPGGLKRETLKQLLERRGISRALTIAVRGMLPKNKLRDKRMMQLTISE
jgi:large subunit ribosomal protein L13